MLQKKITTILTLILLLKLGTSCTEYNVSSSNTIFLDTLKVENYLWSRANQGSLAENISISPVFYIVFSAPVNELSLEQGVTLKEAGAPSNGFLISSALDNSQKRVLLSIQASLKYATDYNIILTPTITSSSGEKLGDSVSIHFSTVKANTNANISRFDFLTEDNPNLIRDCIGKINNSSRSISIDVPFGTNVKSLRPIIQTEAESATVKQSSKTVLDFSFSRNYTVTTQSGNAVTYTVIVNELPNTEREIKSFAFLRQDNSNFLSGDYDAFINENEITLFLPFGTDVTSIVPKIEISENASVSPLNGLANDFSQPQQYTVISQSREIKRYTVRVNFNRNADNNIIAFSFTSENNNFLPSQSYTGIFSGYNNTIIRVSMPDVPDFLRRSLIPTITVSPGSAISPEPSVAQDFSNPMVYRVTSQLGSTKTYTVIVQ